MEQFILKYIYIYIYIYIFSRYCLCGLTFITEFLGFNLCAFYK